MNRIQNRIDDLMRVDLIKTWSLIITLLGDFNRLGKRSISGQEIRIILGHVGIKPEAVRVALHRLKNDGWIDTAKNGREVIYRLSIRGLKETSDAYEDVYRENHKHQDGWKLLLLEEGNSIDKTKPSISIPLFKNVILVPNDGSEHNDSVELDFDRSDIPAWFEERIISRKMLDVVMQLNMLIQNFDSKLEIINDVDALAIRILFLHHWRKMALREQTWAHIWFFKDGPISQYHHQVMKLLKMLNEIGEIRV